MKRRAPRGDSLSRLLIPAIATGVLAGLAFPPAGASWLVWIALVPLLWTIRHQRRESRAFLAGVVAGVVVYLISTRPLVSAHMWAGWQEVELEAMADRRSTQLAVLNGLWLGLSAWASLFWGLAAIGLFRLARTSLPRMALLAPPLFILFPEWLRSTLGWGFHWAFLGNAAIDSTAILQIAALGGVWLLTWLVVLVNVGLLALVSPDEGAKRWPLPVGISGLVAVVLLAGTWRAERTPSQLLEDEGFSAAALQYHQERYTFDDYTPLGLESAYLDLMRQVAQGEAGDVDLLVLPESIAFTTLSLDGSRTPLKPEAAHRSPEDWARTIEWVVGPGGSRFAIVLGLDTSEGSKLHNSLLFWTPSGLGHWYHKQRLVPFAEYQPHLFGLFGLRGEKTYEPGRESAVGEVSGIRVGSFICQEVLFPGVLRRSVLDGAELLVSGGNDGVFGSPAVADVHANLARLRAVETGRYIIRAMKTGISAIIAPTGEEIARSPSSEPWVVVERVMPLSDLTLYARFGDWPVVLAVGILVGGGFIRRPPSIPHRSRRRHPPPPRSSL